MDMLTKKIHTKTRFSRMRRFITAASISATFCTSTPWADVMIYLNRHPNWFRGFARVGVRNLVSPIDFGIGFCIALPRIRVMRKLKKYRHFNCTSYIIRKWKPKFVPNLKITVNLWGTCDNPPYIESS